MPLPSRAPEKVEAQERLAVPSFGLPPELQAAVQQVLREGESMKGFVEAAVRRLVEQRRQLPATASEPRSAPGGGPAPRRHAADELLMQLDAWLGSTGARRAGAG